MAITDPAYLPAAVAQSKRDTMTGITSQEFNQWRHNPITAGFLQYMEDSVAFLREAAADLLEAGQFNQGDVHQDKNPDCLRGQIITLRHLHGIEIQTIQSFYGQEMPKEKQE